MSKKPHHFRRISPFSILMAFFIGMPIFIFAFFPPLVFIPITLIGLMLIALFIYLGIGTVDITEEVLIVRHPSDMVLPWWKRTIPWEDISEIKMTLKSERGFAHWVELAVLILYKDQKGEKQKLWFRPGIVDNWRSLPEIISLICQKATKAEIEPTVYEFCQTGHVKNLEKTRRALIKKAVLSFITSTLIVLIIVWLNMVNPALYNRVVAPFILPLLLGILAVLFVILLWTVWCSLTRKKERKVLIRRLIACLVIAAIFVVLLWFQLR